MCARPAVAVANASYSPSVPMCDGMGEQADPDMGIGKGGDDDLATDGRNVRRGASVDAQQLDEAYAWAVSVGAKLRLPPARLASLFVGIVSLGRR